MMIYKFKWVAFIAVLGLLDFVLANSEFQFTYGDELPVVLSTPIDERTVVCEDTVVKTKNNDWTIKAPKDCGLAEGF